MSNAGGGKARLVARWILSFAMVVVGIMHFTSPDGFVRIVPSFLPSPLLLVYVSGVFEIVLGLAIRPERTRRLAAYGLVALYLAVFPANINMAVNEIQLNPDDPMPVWVMWARLPFQVVFVAWALWVGDILDRRKQPR